MPVSRLGSTHPSVYPGGGSKIRASIFSSSTSIHGDCLVHPTEPFAYSTDFAPFGCVALPGVQLKRHDAMATVAFEPRYVPPSLDLQTGQRVHKAIRTLALYDDG
ncbi:hypothetical protein E4U56_004924 [Claviceps arundinis]|uniref:Uncharacterized protein n=1 Tax=Claviceps arundinis TaxID=1623583 RepID=A0A9P7SRD7_9HYPO|nr:hypothetical protein E4U56_004924 [Claviceps arundinis]